ncbi:DUF2461 family protein [Frigoribacterium sp. CG_9.8]|uniref:DUF2461 family protein n=1 Tax=Frigoribacterium sp. CG_9.8 TaxID=2787733 RepID=UPI0018C93D32|nr:DUF2461 family protein [Frigoribacterium sp. CG_9.8]MBG6107365.1 hypothetical protein [Frigoribacterium sp. CG_9.8]
MNTLNQRPLTLQPIREVPVRTGIYPQAGSRKWALWRRRGEADEAVGGLFFTEKASVASALCWLVVESTPTIAARVSVEHEVREGAGIFLAAIAQDDTQAFFEAHRLEYIANIRQPLEDLLGEVQDLCGSGRVMRPNRDVRFSHDKSPDKTSAAMSAG